MTADLLYLVRLTHLIAGIGWLGEVITINFVLLPALFAATSKDRTVLLYTVFPYLFRLATVLGGLALASGLVLFLWSTQLQPLAAIHSHWGLFILTGGTLGAVLYAFHLFEESGAERTIAAQLVLSQETGDPRQTERIMKHLAFFPRAGMVVLIIVVALMVGASHLG